MYWYTSACLHDPQPEPCRCRLLRPPAATSHQSGGEEIRLGLVQRVRQEIAAGTYDTAEKWETAIDRLLAQLD
jgi:hypothetical protein